jgi:hypothetical protein
MPSLRECRQPNAGFWHVAVDRVIMTEWPLSGRSGRAEGFRSDSFDSPDHFLGGSAVRRQKQDTRINRADDKMRNPMGKGLRLPGASAGSVKYSEDMMTNHY